MHQTESFFQPDGEKREDFGNTFRAAVSAAKRPSGSFTHILVYMFREKRGSVTRMQMLE